MHTMRITRSPKIIGATIGAAAVLSLAGFGVASAAIPDSGGTIHACYKTPAAAHGSPLQVIDSEAGGSCASGYAPLSWSNKTPTLSETTVTATTPPFDGGNQPSATAQCPTGDTMTGGGISVPVYGMIIMDTRPSTDGTGWYGSFTAGPVGYGATVYARCAHL